MKKLRNLKIVNCQLSIVNLQRQGFTLLETLLSLVLLIIILGAVYGSFFSTVRAIDRFEDVSLKYHEARTAIDYMRRELEGAFFKNIKPSEKEGNITALIIEDRDILGKTASKLRFMTFSSKSGIKTIEYHVHEENGNLILKKTESGRLASSGGYIYEVMEGIESFTAETLYNNKWVKTWDTAQTGIIPGVLRVSIEFKDKDGRIKLTEYAKPMVGKHL